MTARPVRMPRPGDPVEEADTYGLLIPRYRLAMREDAPMPQAVIERIYERVDEMRYQWAQMAVDPDLATVTQALMTYYSESLRDAPLVVAKPRWVWAERGRGAGR